MKRNYKLVLLALMMMGVFNACTKKIEEAYLNPNAPVRVPVEELLPQITSTMTANYAGHGPLHDARVISLYTQYFATHTLVLQPILLPIMNAWVV